MNIEIKSTARGVWSTYVSFTADGIQHTALVYPPDRAGNCRVSFEAEGNSCTTTHELDDQEMLAAATAAIAGVGQ